MEYPDKCSNPQPHVHLVNPEFYIAMFGAGKMLGKGKIYSVENHFLMFGFTVVFRFFVLALSVIIF